MLWADIRSKIDFNVALFVVYDGRRLFIHHRDLDKLLPPGGRIKLDEAPEAAALRAPKEDSGLEVEFGASARNCGGVTDLLESSVGFLGSSASANIKPRMACVLFKVGLRRSYSCLRVASSLLAVPAAHCQIFSFAKLPDFSHYWNR